MDLHDRPPSRRSRAPAPDLTVRDRFEWTRAAGIGPPPTVFGDLEGRRVIELGCGGGHNLAHLAVHHRVEAVGVDHAPFKVQRARTLYGDVSGLTFVQAGAIAFLQCLPACSIDLCLSIFGVFSFLEPTEPGPLLSATARVLRPGGRLALTLRATDTTDLVLIYARS